MTPPPQAAQALYRVAPDVKNSSIRRVEHQGDVVLRQAELAGWRSGPDTTHPPAAPDSANPVWGMPQAVPNPEQEAIFTRARDTAPRTISAFPFLVSLVRLDDVHTGSHGGSAWHRVQGEE